MPYKSEKIKLKGLQDRRRRLTDEQRKQIKELYQTGNFSLNDLAKQWRDYQKTGEEWNEIIREHRRYKQKLYKEGKLKEDNNKQNK